MKDKVNVMRLEAELELSQPSNTQHTTCHPPTLLTFRVRGEQGLGGASDRTFQLLESRFCY